LTSQGGRSDYRQFANRLADELVAKGAITSAAVEAAFRRVPRHLFIDRAKVWFDEEREWREVVCDHEHPEPEVLDRIYRDGVIQISDSSTSSEPTCMAWMLEDLQLAPGMRVFEVGTGSGWNAALIAEVVGDASLVYSVEVDEALADSARRHLEEAGYGGATVIAGDGAEGYGAEAPYDTIIVTCGCSDLAPAWVEQLSEGGTMLCPLSLAPWGDPPLLLRKEEGELAGRFTRWMSFVVCTSDLVSCPVPPERMDIEQALALGARRSPEPHFALSSSLTDRDLVWSFFLLLSLHMVPEERLVTAHEVFPCGLADRVAGEACVLTPDGKQIQVVGGTRPLERFQNLARQWQNLGCPRLKDYAVTLRPAGEATEVPAGGGVLRRRHFDYVIAPNLARQETADAGH